MLQLRKAFFLSAANNIRLESSMTKVTMSSSNSTARYYGFKVYGYWSSFNSWLIETVTPDKPSHLPPINNEILLKSANQISCEIKSGNITCTQVIEAYLDRIQQVNPIINAIVDVRAEDALKEARDLDHQIQQERRQGASTSNAESIFNKPLLGVPVTIKNSISVQGATQSAGLWRAKDRKGEFDSLPVKQLKQAGAIVLGITNTPEALVFWESKNKVHGLSRNPYDLSRGVGGSSGGEGGALGSACSVIGLGSDMAGSVRLPAACCGVYGHKPSVGVIESFDGFFPEYSKNLWPYLTLGPMTRYADDLKAMLKVVGKPEAVEKLNLDAPVDLSKLKIFVLDPNPDNLLQNPTPEIIETIKRACEHFTNNHGTKVSDFTLKHIGKCMSIWGACLKDADPSPLKAMLEGRDGENNNGQAENIWPRLEMMKGWVGLSNHEYYTMFLTIMDGYLVPDKKKIGRLLSLKKELMDEVYSLLGEDGIFVYPTIPYVAPKTNTVLFKVSDCGYCGLFNILEMPATHITMGLSQESGMPIGFQVAAGPGMDRLTLTVASELEKAFGGWVSPSTIDIKITSKI